MVFVLVLRDRLDEWRANSCLKICESLTSRCNSGHVVSLDIRLDVGTHVSGHGFAFRERRETRIGRLRRMTGPAIDTRIGISASPTLVCGRRVQVRRFAEGGKGCSEAMSEDSPH